MDERKSIEKTRAGFEAGFAEHAYYARQTQSADPPDAILRQIRPDGPVLDLGTGSGYLAFPLAQQNPDCPVTGLDIVGETLRRNQARASALGLRNLTFVAYDGMHFPFPDHAFHAVVTRYALHHFPNIRRTFQEISRVLQPDGQLLIVDPTPNPGDNQRFVDSYMQMKDDGHIRFYTQEEFVALAAASRMTLECSSAHTIRFPRRNADAYQSLLAATDQSIAESYAVAIQGDEIYITQTVLHLCFRKDAL